MKKILGFVILVFLALAFNSCETVNTNEFKTVSDYNIYGEIHNNFLTYIYEDYRLNDTELDQETAFSNLAEDSYDYINNKYKNVLEGYPNKNDYSQLVEFVISDNLRSFVKNQDNLEFLQEALNSGQIDEFEKNSLETLLNLDENLSIKELREVLNNISQVYQNRYPSENIPGTYLGIALSIGNNSLDWWSNHPTAHTSSDYISERIAPWVAADIVGAVGGMIFAGLYSDATGGSGDVGGGMLAGAIFGSTGIFGKIGRWASKWF